MYDSSELVELSRFARVHADSTVLEVWPGRALHHHRPRCRHWDGCKSHRVAASDRSSTVRAEVETAGFVLDAQSTLLSNKDDPHSANVFDPSIKGETDRFAYRFVRL